MDAASRRPTRDSRHRARARRASAPLAITPGPRRTPRARTASAAGPPGRQTRQPGTPLPRCRRRASRSAGRLRRRRCRRATRGPTAWRRRARCRRRCRRLRSASPKPAPSARRGAPLRAPPQPLVARQQRRRGVVRPCAGRRQRRRPTSRRRRCRRRFYYNIIYIKNSKLCLNYA